MVYVFVGNVHHGKLKFEKGMECPKDIQDEMLSKGLIAELPQPVVPKPAPKAEEKSSKK